MASENGWEPSHAPADLLEWRTIPGTNPPVHLQFMKGWPSTVMTAYAADFNAYIEPLRDADSASFTPTNSVATSNHLNATAMDLNWDSHAFRVSYAGFDQAKIQRMRDLLAFYNFEGLQVMFWAQDWDDPKDCMHHQMGYNTWNNPTVLRFIQQRIRADGFSTYKRDGAAPPPAPAPSEMTVPLTPTANGRWTSPSPAWAHLINRESGGNPTIIQQIHDVNSGGNEAEGLFQITPRTWRAHNGQEFAPSARSATPQQQAIVAARIFTRNPTGSDWGAGLPGREDAKQLADGLVPITDVPIPTQGDDMALVPQDQWDRVYRELTQLLPSLSPIRHLGEGPQFTMARLLQNIDSSEHVEIVKLLAGYGHPPTLALLREVAGADPNLYPDRQADALMAQAILADVTSGPAATVVNNAMAAPAPQVVYVDRPVPATAEVATTNGSASTGQVIGQAYDALEALRLADALPIEGRAPLSALIAVLQTKNGSQL